MTIIYGGMSSDNNYNCLIDKLQLVTHYDKVIIDSAGAALGLLSSQLRKSNNYREGTRRCRIHE